MRIELDGARMQDRTGMHEQLREKLALPDYYGSNLDALNDCLSECAHPAEIYIRNFQNYAALDVRYGAILLDVLAENGVALGHD